MLVDNYVRFDIAINAAEKSTIPVGFWQNMKVGQGRYVAVHAQEYVKGNCYSRFGMAITAAEKHT